MEKKTLKLKLISQEYKVIHRTFSSLPQSDWPKFGFVNHVNSEKIKCAHHLLFCREYISERIRNDKTSEIKKDKLRLVISQKAIYHRHRHESNKELHLDTKAVEQDLNLFKDEVFTSLKMINVIEKHYGWPLSKIYPVQIEKWKEKNLPINYGYYYIVASRRWLKSPAMLSLYLLLYRIVIKHKKFNFKREMKTLGDVIKVLNLACDISPLPMELAFFKTHGKRWKYVLDNYRNLFSSRKLKDLYKPDLHSYLFTEGINELCDLRSKDEILNTKFSKIVKKSGC